MNSPTAIITASGKFFDPIHPDHKLVRIEDIAHALSRQTRFSGHVNGFWSGANHSLLVSYLVPDWLKLPALLHDGFEAYLIDLPSPLKSYFSSYCEIENAGHASIAKAFGLAYPWGPIIKQWDSAALWAESEVFMHGWADWNFRPQTDRDFMRVAVAKRAILDGVGQPWINRVAGRFGFYSAGATQRAFLREFSRLHGIVSDQEAFNRKSNFLNAAVWAPV